jgi:hypothetical protein
MVVCLSSVIMVHPSVKDDIDTFMMNNVIPLLSSEVGYLRAVAAEVVGALEQRFVTWKTPEVCRISLACRIISNFSLGSRSLLQCDCQGYG